MWKLGSLVIITAIAAFLWLWQKPMSSNVLRTAQAQDVAQPLSEQNGSARPAQAGNGNGQGQRPQGASGQRPAQADAGGGWPRSGNGEGRPANAGNGEGRRGQAGTGNGRRPAGTGNGNGRPANANGGGNRPAQAGGGGRPNAGNGGGRPAQAGAGGGRPGGAGGRRGGGRPPSLVITSAAKEALINDRLKAVGTGTAVASVSVVPLTGGLLTGVLVNAGQSVKKGQVLATLDNAYELIARDRASRTARDASTDAARLRKLFRSNTATEVELNRATAALADAELSLRDAELRLERRTVTAPISGIVGLVDVDSGNYVTVQSELVTIDDRSTIIVEFWIPERFANQVSLNQTVEAIALANPADTYRGVISGIGSRIETDSRTLPVQAKIENASDSLRPGMSFEVLLRFDGEEFPAVSPLSIQWDSNGSYIWRIVENKAERVPVRIIQRNPESVLVDGDLKVDDAIVTEGLLSLRPGATVRTQGGRP